MADEFQAEFRALHEDVRTEILALSIVPERFGPQLGRPRVDTRKGTRQADERFDAIWLGPERGPNHVRERE
jgi:hypothetical protein